MQNALIIPWPDHLEEHIFASPTSLLDSMLLIDILHQENHLTDNDLQQLKKEKPVGSLDLSTFSKNLEKRK